MCQLMASKLFNNAHNKKNLFCPIGLHSFLPIYKRAHSASSPESNNNCSTIENENEASIVYNCLPRSGKCLHFSISPNIICFDICFFVKIREMNPVCSECEFRKTIFVRKPTFLHFFFDILFKFQITMPFVFFFSSDKKKYQQFIDK